VGLGPPGGASLGWPALAHDRDVLRSHDDRFRAVAPPPLRPAAFFWAVVPPWLVLRLRTPDPDFLPPRLEAPGEFAIFAARSLDIPFSFRASYCFSFLTLGLLSGRGDLLLAQILTPLRSFPEPAACIRAQHWSSEWARVVVGLAPPSLLIRREATASRSQDGQHQVKEPTEPGGTRRNF
jgi:hypothetical protein